MYTFLMVFSSALLLIGAKADDKHYIESPHITGWGTWGKLERCPEDFYVIGMQLKVERSDGWKDDTGLNGIRFFCSKLGEGVSGEVDSDTPTITSSVGRFGDWKGIQLCGEVPVLSSQTSGVIGFQLRSEKERGRLDDTAANNLRIICSDFGANHVSEEIVQGDGTDWGEWTDLRQCDRGYAVCGLQTQVEGFKAKDDDTSLNNLKAECCKLKLVELKKEVVVEDRPAKKHINPADFARSYKEAIERPRTAVTERQTEASVTTTSSTTTSTTTKPPTQETTVVSSSPLLAYFSDSPATLTSAKRDDDARYREKLLSEELSKLATIEFTTESAYEVKIPVDESASEDDIQDANPIVPPEVIHTAVQATDGNHEDSNKDPDPSKFQYISGTISVQKSTSAPKVNSERLDSSSEIHKKPTITSGQSSFLLRVETFSLVFMYLIVRLLS